MNRSFLTRYAWLSIAAALATIGLKTGAYLLTGSVGLFSDALESLVNLAGAIMALVVLRVAAQPPDEEHAYGHSKAEYFSSGVEGALILVAAASIGFASVQRLLNPRELEAIGLGLAVSVMASLINLAVALVIARAGKRHRSPTLEANAQHLLTDVWTSVGVLAAIGLVAVSGWLWLDPVVALLVAANITWTGSHILRGSAMGLMDTALPPADMAALKAILDKYVKDGVNYHALRTRQSGARRFVSLHVLVPGLWTVQRGHQLLERLEAEIRGALENVTVLTHLESLEDVASFKDQNLDREAR
ncbi:MAG: cation diffusion facilitator family transporter [Chloroflexi bacterium]|nr:cation diffusion facilitator family transporter [Chloroflexota bacterium]